MHVLKLQMIFINPGSNYRPYWAPAGEKRAEVKAANPDYKVGDIAKVRNLEALKQLKHFFYAGDGQDVEGAG